MHSSCCCRYNKEVPSYRIELSNSQTFADLLSLEPVSGTIPTAFIDKLKGIIVINLDALMCDTWGTFVVNLVMNVMEEILHATFPFSGEIEIKKMTYELSERYLEWKIPADYKRDSLETAARPSY